MLKEIADKACVHPNVLVRDLFDRFLPEEKRLKKLGPAIKPEEILTLKGAAGNGKESFSRRAGRNAAGATASRAKAVSSTRPKPNRPELLNAFNCSNTSSNHRCRSTPIT